MVDHLLLEALKLSFYPMTDSTWKTSGKTSERNIFSSPLPNLEWKCSIIHLIVLLTLLVRCPNKRDFKKSERPVMNLRLPDPPNYVSVFQHFDDWKMNCKCGRDGMNASLKAPYPPSLSLQWDVSRFYLWKGNSFLEFRIANWSAYLPLCCMHFKIHQNGFLAEQVEIWTPIASAVLPPLSNLSSVRLL